MQANNNECTSDRARTCVQECVPHIVRGPVACLFGDHSAQTLTDASRAPDTR